MKRAFRAVLIAILAGSAALGSTGVARATISDSSADNVQSGSNRSSGNQNGASKSGSAVGGQVVGVVSSGRTSVDAKNTSKDSSVQSGDAKGNNSANTFTGLNSVDNETTIGGSTGDVNNVAFAENVQDGDNRSTYSQSSNATTGDGVAGEVIGVVTSAGGSASIVAQNTSDRVDVTTGAAKSNNTLASFTGLDDSNDGGIDVSTVDINNVCTEDSCDNVQSGSNRTTTTQSSTAHSGDGVAGQVIGAVSAGATSIDASNTSQDSAVDTGNATSNNDSSSFVGLHAGGATNVGSGADVTGVVKADNLQEGNNTANINQTSSATSGDGVAGEVIGAVTSAGGSTSIVAANKTTNSDVSTGSADSLNSFAAFVGLNESDNPLNVIGGGGTGADILNSCINPEEPQCQNVQQGDNRLTGSQASTSHTGDGVAGQVLGVVSAGRTSLDATNHTDDSSVQTGDAKSNNVASEFVGLNDAGQTTTVGTGGVTDISGVSAENLQQGDNRKNLTQTADATSGDAIAGQVSGVVTGAGGSASVVLDNTSTRIDSTSGSSTFNNKDAGFVGLNEGGTLTVIG